MINNLASPSVSSCLDSNRLHVFGGSISFLVPWLQQLLRDRIHHELSLELDSTTVQWHLRCSGADGTITMPLLPVLYQLGSNPELPCSTIAVAEQGFRAIVSDLPAPGRSEIGRASCRERV